MLPVAGARNGLEFLSQFLPTTAGRFLCIDIYNSICHKSEANLMVFQKMPEGSVEKNSLFAVFSIYATVVQSIFCIDICIGKHGNTVESTLNNQELQKAAHNDCC